MGLFVHFIRLILRETFLFSSFIEDFFFFSLYFNTIYLLLWQYLHFFFFFRELVYVPSITQFVKSGLENTPVMSFFY